MYAPLFENESIETCSWAMTYGQHWYLASGVAVVLDQADCILPWLPVQADHVVSKMKVTLEELQAQSDRPWSKY